MGYAVGINETCRACRRPETWQREEKLQVGQFREGACSIRRERLAPLIVRTYEPAGESSS